MDNGTQFSRMDPQAQRETLRMSTTTARRFTGTLRLRDLSPPLPPQHLHLVETPPAEPEPPEPEPEPPEAARVRNLATVREHLPAIFDDERLPPLPADIRNQLAAIGIPEAEAGAVLAWWREWRRLRAAHLDDARIARRVVALGLLAELAPEVFNLAAPVPFAIGIDRQIAEIGGMGDETIADVMRWWTRSPQYRAALANGTHRHNIDGSVAGEILPEHRGRRGA